jgi:hypothetical protein
MQLRSLATAHHTACINTKHMHMHRSGVPQHSYCKMLYTQHNTCTTVLCLGVTV